MAKVSLGLRLEPLRVERIDKVVALLQERHDACRDGKQATRAEALDLIVSLGLDAAELKLADRPLDGLR